MSFQIAIYLLLAVFIVLVELRRNKEVIFDMMTFFNLFFLLVYSIIPVILLLGGVKEYANANLYRGVFYFGKSISTPLIIFLAYLSFLGGYYWTYPRTVANSFHFDFRLKEDDIVKIFPFLFAVVIGAVFVYIEQFGGLRETIAVAELYRNGEYEPPKFAFVMRLFPLNTYILYYTFFKAFVQKNSRYQDKYFLFFILSFLIFSLIVVLFNSRSYIILTLGGLYVISAIYNNRYYLLSVTLTFMAAVIVVEYGDPFFSSIPSLYNDGLEAFLQKFIAAKEDEYSIGVAGVIKNFSHPIVSLETALAVAGYELEFNKFFEWIVAFLNLIPQKLTGFTPPKTIMDTNTFYTYGDANMASILPGLLGSFAYSLGVAGVWIGSFLYGLQGGVLNRVFLNVYQKYPGFIVFFYIFAFNYGYFVFDGDFVTKLKTHFLLFVAVGVLVFFTNIYREKEYAKKI